METAQVDAHVSLLSRMNAFYGIPNLSQETTAAVHQGAPAPEVYTPENNQPPQATTAETNGATARPVESFFTEATEQVEISDQALALQQQGQAASEPAQAESATGTTPATGETQPESSTSSPANTLNSEPEPASGFNNESPPATSALNAEAPAPLDSNITAAQPANGDNGQSVQVNAPVAAGTGYTSNAGDPGALFSALG